MRVLDRALSRRSPGPYQLQAAIAALHVEDETDWAQIARSTTSSPRSAAHRWSRSTTRSRSRWPTAGGRARAPRRRSTSSSTTSSTPRAPTSCDASARLDEAAAAYRGARAGHEPRRAGASSTPAHRTHGRECARARLRQGRLRAACDRGAGRRAAGREGRAARDRAGDPAQVPREHPARAAPGRARRSQRGAEGGYRLARPAEEISLAEVIRAVEGPLANVRGAGPRTRVYGRRRARDVWVALRASVRSVLERVALADIVAGARRTGETRSWQARRKTISPGASSSSSASVARQLRRQLLAVGDQQLDAHLEAEVDDPLDHRLEASRRPPAIRTRGRAAAPTSPRRLTGPTNP